MHLEQLKNFLVVADVLNYHKAAEKILIAQPALSRQIMQLEEEVGATLFDRSKKRICLTPAGRVFREDAEAIVSQWNQSKLKARLVHEGKAGKLRVGHSSSAMHTLIPCLLRYFRLHSPDLKLTLTESNNLHVFEMLTTNKIDFGFLPNAMISEGFKSITVYRENYMLILPKTGDHKPKSKNLKNYRNDKWILHPASDGIGYMESIQRIFERAGFNPDTVHESPNTSSVLRMVAEGFGNAIMGKTTLKGFDLNIEAVELDNIPEQLEMKLIWKESRENELSIYLDQIMSFIEKEKDFLVSF